MSVTPPRPEESASPSAVRPQGVSEPTPLPALTDATTLETPQVYRPLSLLAVLALILGVAFSLLVLVGGLMPFARAYPRSFVVLLLLGPILGGLGAVLTRQKGAERIATIAALALSGVLVFMGLGGLVAFSSSSPWELGGWAWILLFAAVLVSFLSLAQIRSSEGAQAGLGLARWGLYLSLFFGGFYLLYLGGNQLAVSSQAQLATDRYVEMIRTGDLPQAFRETLKPGGRPGGGNLREEIELGYNAPRGREAGEYTGFCNSPMVQGIRLGGETTIKRTSVSSELTQTGYFATARYLVTNDFGQFEAVVVAQSVDVGGRREWQVKAPECRIDKTVKQSALATEIGRAANDSNVVATRWLEAMTTKQPEAAYLLTLPLEQRNAQGKVLLTSRPEVAALAGSASSMAMQLKSMTKEREALTRGTEEFQSGKTSIDSSNFVSFNRDDPQAKKNQIQEVHDFFRHRARVPAGLDLVPVQFPTTRRVGNELEVARPVRLHFEALPGAHPRYSIECELICRGTPGDGPVLDHYRVVTLRLGRAGLDVSQAKGPNQPPMEFPPQPKK